MAVRACGARIDWDAPLSRKWWKCPNTGKAITGTTAVLLVAIGNRERSHKLVDPKSIVVH